MFQQELQALLVAGVHPHILRLLESFEPETLDDDVLVLEHCDGGDVYELYAANDGASMLEAFVIQLIRQLLMALQHLVAKGIEHRDVKPENLLLFGGASSGERRGAAPLLKLGDFGWASVVPPGCSPPPLPPDGVGSLWYAPPELNPPGMTGGGASKQLDEGLHLPGSSDMWSVGIITYLLLIGHSPFNAALQIPDTGEREAEVMRLAEAGQINTMARAWPRLSPDARSFIAGLVQPSCAHRMTVEQAWEHPWIKNWQDAADGMGCAPEPLMRGCDERARVTRWQSLDCFQQLAWLAVARAVAEPELAEFSPLQAFINDEGNNCYNYVDSLAIEMATLARPGWLSPDSGWGDVLRLAFHYLDVDRDCVLGHWDLAQHLVGDDAEEVAGLWLNRWTMKAEGLSSMGPFSNGRQLTYSDFCAAILAGMQDLEGADSPAGVGDSHAVLDSVASPCCRSRLPHGLEGERAAGGYQPCELEGDTGAPKATHEVLVAKGAPSDKGDEDPRLNAIVDAALDLRRHAIDEVCQRFLDEEFDDFGFGI